MSEPKLIKAAKELRKIWKAYEWGSYLRSKDRKRETDSLWVRYTKIERHLIIKIAHGH